MAVSPPSSRRAVLRGRRLVAVLLAGFGVVFLAGFALGRLRSGGLVVHPAVPRSPVVRHEERTDLGELAGDRAELGAARGRPVEDPLDPRVAGPLRDVDVEGVAVGLECDLPACLSRASPRPSSRRLLGGRLSGAVGFLAAGLRGRLGHRVSFAAGFFAAAGCGAALVAGVVFGAVPSAVTLRCFPNCWISAWWIRSSTASRSLSDSDVEVARKPLAVAWPDRTERPPSSTSKCPSP